jgi:NitT/TauT family transport system ATP-binding protein
MPLVVLWLGIGMSANLFLGAFMASFPIIIGTYTGVSCLERDFTLLAKSFGASRRQTLLTIVLPGLTPYVLSGLRLGVNYAMVGILIAEFFASSRGLGYRMVLYMSNFEIAYFFVCMVIVVVLTLVSTSVVYGIEHFVQAWRPSAFGGASGDVLYRGSMRTTTPRPASGGPILEVDRLTVDFASNSGDNLRVLDGLSLSVAPGEFLSVIGPSGCGKTTLLHTLNGLLRPTSGRIEVAAPSIELVFQRPHLLPWRTLLDNATYGLECRGYSKLEARQQATYLLERMRLSGHLSDYPHQLSEGMKQRVNLARALLVKPDLLLMDEPFANLDEITRRSLQDDLLALWSDRRFAIVFVSHSVEEVVYLSDRVAILTDKPTVIQEMVAVDLPQPRGRGAEEKYQLLVHEERIKKMLTL